MTALQTDIEQLEQYELRLGDDALILSHRLGEWLTRAPDLEEEVALANIALDLLGQARFLLSAAGVSTGRSEDELAYGRGDREYRNALIAELPNGDFAHTVLRLLFFSTYQCGLYRALSASTDAHLAAFAGKALYEVEYHREYALGWTVRLGDGTAESHDRAAAALAELWPYTAELFAADDLTTALAVGGIAPDPAVLKAEWIELITVDLATATLGANPGANPGVASGAASGAASGTEPGAKPAAKPGTSWRPAGGRVGLHTEDLSYLLAEMQSVHRAYPGAAW